MTPSPPDIAASASTVAAVGGGLLAAVVSWLAAQPGTAIVSLLLASIGAAVAVWNAVVTTWKAWRDDRRAQAAAAMAAREHAARMRQAGQ